MKRSTVIVMVVVSALGVSPCACGEAPPVGEQEGSSEASTAQASGISQGEHGSSSDEASSTGGPVTTGTSTDSVDSSSESGGSPACELAPSGPIVVDADDQVIENLHIVSTRGAAITIEGHPGVTIRNVWIEHAGGPGISIGAGSDDVLIENVAVEHTGAPAEGENPSDELVNIECHGSARPVIANARLVRGSSGVYLVECPEATLSWLEGHDFRGPFPRGQLVQFDKSSGSVLEDFSVVNPQDTSWPEDNVNVYQSVDVEIRRGLVDGNNSPSGVGVIFDGDMGLGIVEDVDAIRMGNGCFSDYAGSDGVVFRRTRCRENVCEDQGRGLPLSNALMWAGHPEYTEIRIEDSQYFASCNGNLVWPEESFAVIELEEVDFPLREPIDVELCWE